MQSILTALNLSVKMAEGFIDEELRVDLLIHNKTKTLCGIQVKPKTFKKMREGVIIHNKKANEKWGNPVFYLFYDKNEKFTNLDEVINSIIKTIH